MSEVHHLGIGHRLAAEPTKMMGQALDSETAYAEFVAIGLSYADIAHAVMLCEQKIIPADKAVILLEALLRLHNEDDPVWKMGLAEGDIYDHRDAWLQREIKETSGWLHVGRARREAINIGWYIGLRHGVLSLQGAMADLAAQLEEVARAHRDTLMPDYTYLQHAHPTTLAHYLLGFVDPLLRDIARLDSSLADFDSSPAGAASTNGSRLDLNRERMRELLGFGRVVHHARDAMWQPDVAINCMSVLASVNTTLGRLVEELLLWSTSEFGFVELSDAHCRTSVIMPQKKNPYALSHLRSTIRRSIGDWVTVVTSNHTATGQVDNRIASYSIIPGSVRDTASACRLLREILADARFDAAAMRSVLEGGATWGTELVDWIVLNERIDPRSAHKIVGSAVRHAGPGADAERAAAAFKAAYRDAMGREWPDSGLDFSELLDPARIVAHRRGEGSAGEAAMDDMLAAIGRDLAACEEKRKSFGHHALAMQALMSRANEIIQTRGVAT